MGIAHTLEANKVNVTATTEDEFGHELARGSHELGGAIFSWCTSYSQQLIPHHHTARHVLQAIRSSPLASRRHMVSFLLKRISHDYAPGHNLTAPHRRYQSTSNSKSR